MTHLCSLAETVCLGPSGYMFRSTRAIRPGEGPWHAGGFFRWRWGWAPSPGPRCPSPVAIVFLRSVTKVHGYEYSWPPPQAQLEPCWLNKATYVHLSRLLFSRLGWILLTQPKNRTAGCPFARDAALTTVWFCHLGQSFAAEAGVAKSSGPNTARGFAACSPVSVLAVECVGPRWMTLGVGG